MAQLLLNTIALEPNRWTADKFPYFSLDSLLPAIHRAGFKALEIWQFHLTRLSVLEVHGLKKQLELQEMTTPIIGLYPKFHEEGKRAEAEWATLMKMVEYAKLLEASGFKIFVGAIGSGKISSDQKLRSLNMISRFLDTCEKENLFVTGETHQDTLFDSLDALQETQNQLDHSNLHVCFQPYDFKDTPKAVKDFQSVNEMVNHLHFQGRKDGDFSWLDDADINYETLFEAFGASNFDGYMSIEFVKDCVVEQPRLIDIPLVLENAKRDKVYLEKLCVANGIPLSA